MQIFQGTQISRPVPFDRNGVVRASGYNLGAAGPFAAITALTYTVPAGKRGFLEVLTGIVQRQVAAAALGVDMLLWQYTKSGGAAFTLQYTTLYKNGVGEQDTENLTSFGFMGPGDKLEALVIGGSTGGSVLWNGAYKLMEFDP